MPFLDQPIARVSARCPDADGGQSPPARLRVLLCAFACNPRGATGGEDVLGWHIVEQIARYHDTWVLTASYNRPWIDEALAKQPQPSLRVEYVGLPLPWVFCLWMPGAVQGYAYLWQLAAYRAARRLHRRMRFNLAHHVTYANDWMASFIGALLPVPYVRGPGGGAHRVPGSFLREFSPLGRIWERWRTLGQRLFRLDPFFIRGQARARALLVCTREALEAIPARWRHKAQLVPVNGISGEDLARLSQVSVRTGPAPFVVLSAGKLLRLKGFPMALRAFKQLADRHPDVRLEIVGEGPDQALLEQLIRTLGLTGRADLIAWLPRAKFLERLGACDAFLFPSLRDGGGAVVIEAMAAGKPVVCFDLGGPGLHVTEACGITVPARTPSQAVEALAEALERLYADGGFRRRLGEAGRIRAQTVYDWDRLGERVRALYEVVSRSGRAEAIHQHDALAAA